MKTSDFIFNISKKQEKRMLITVKSPTEISLNSNCLKTAGWQGKDKLDVGYNYSTGEIALKRGKDVSIGCSKGSTVGSLTLSTFLKAVNFRFDIEVTKSWSRRFKKITYQAKYENNMIIFKPKTKSPYMNKTQVIKEFTETQINEDIE